jgi:steroid 5-alpha reductase family enzyme
VSYYPVLMGVLFLYMNFWFFVSLIKKRNDVADVAWGLGFVLVAWVSFFLSREMSVRGAFVCILVSVWGLRLAQHIHARNKGRAEDYRYLAWRKAWGRWFYPRAYVQVYLLQGFFLFLIALPIFFVNKSAELALSFFDVLGGAIWFLGFYFEAVGDAQLSRFIKDPENKGKLMQNGLWAYTRHPNYFGEVTQWWGIWFIAFAVPNGWLSIVGPITITCLILYVSGIPLLEKKMSEHPDFSAYKQRVSIFFPWPRKR